MKNEVILCLLLPGMLILNACSGAAAGDAIPPIHVTQSPVEVVSDETSSGGDGGNNWGGHQTRIVHTRDGIFTAYTVETGDINRREWRLTMRQADGTWNVIGRGEAGRDPVNLLAGSDGTLYIVGWPQASATLWSGRPQVGIIQMTASAIPDQAHRTKPYGAAGIDARGNLCVVSSEGGQGPGGRFYISCYQPSRGKWVTRIDELDYRYCYTYVFPGARRELSLVSTRDVIWSALGYSQPSGPFGYVFNAFGLWHTRDVSRSALERLAQLEEKPSEEFRNVNLFARDAYIDTRGNMHVIYTVQGQSTLGETIARKATLAPDGSMIADLPLPSEAGFYARIFQDWRGRFFLLGSAGWIYPMDREGIHFGAPVRLELEGYDVEYSGFGLSVPRTGTPPGDIMDVVFPSSDGRAWIYFQLDFSRP
ncbi:MAG: hypothetical protein FJZ87_09095 [Chloroflexi bacterium]|nr:hypothetical protein [Chloroflexota bacterium]